jgi:hypothetical protein
MYILKNSMKKRKLENPDLQDSEKDRRKLQPDEAILELPDVEDIPGQENIKPPILKEMQDATISSADEEGSAIFADDENLDRAYNVSRLERFLLEKSASGSSYEQAEIDIKAISLDQTDQEGDPLNEGNLATDHFGEDLDLPESEEIQDDETAANDGEENK